jgi:GNAT superfamily N-acetyltransferase
MLGVDSSFQKQGFSRKLLNVAIKLSEEHSVPIYLETFKPENEKLYQHFGFSTNEKYPIPNTNLFLFSMLRKS